MTTAIILPFPIARRQAFIQKQANQVMCLNASSARCYLEYQLKIQRGAMQRRGVADDLIARELKCMESAVRQELLRGSTSTVAT
jgi:hypothetical protein